MSRRLRFAPVLSLLLCGCIEKDVSGDVTTITYAIWVPVVVLLGGLAGAWAMRANKGRIFWALAFIGLLATFLFAPSTAMDKLTLSPQEIHLRTGFYGSTKADIALGEVRQATLIAEEKRGRRGRKSTSYYMVFNLPSGEQRIPLGNTLVENSVDDLLAVLTENNIDIVDRTGGL